MSGRELAERIEALEAENARLREAIAEQANTINIVGSAYHRATIAIEDIVTEVKSNARAALKGGSDEG